MHIFVFNQLVGFIRFPNQFPSSGTAETPYFAQPSMTKHYPVEVCLKFSIWFMLWKKEIHNLGKLCIKICKVFLFHMVSDVAKKTIFELQFKQFFLLKTIFFGWQTVFLIENSTRALQEKGKEHFLNCFCFVETLSSHHFEKNDSSTKSYANNLFFYMCFLDSVIS